jgi:hypothetical protein
VVEILIPDVATVVVVLVVVTVVQPLPVDVELVRMLVLLVEVEVIGSLLVTTLVSKVDDALLVTESRLE